MFHINTERGMEILAAMEAVRPLTNEEKAKIIDLLLDYPAENHRLHQQWLNIAPVSYIADWLWNLLTH